MRDKLLNGYSITYTKIIYLMVLKMMKNIRYVNIKYNENNF